MENILCCLCKADLLQDKRRRKFNGPSCAGLKEKLQTMSSTPLESLVETSSESAYLCNACELQLKAVETMEAKLQKLRREIIEKLSNLQPLSALQGSLQSEQKH